MSPRCICLHIYSGSFAGTRPHRERADIDISLLETTTSLLSNVASNYLISGEEAPRLGNGHPNIVPYQAFRTQNGYVVVSCGNDRLYQALCQLLGRDDLANDPSFATNPQRVRNREQLVPALQEEFLLRSTEEWLPKLREAGIPCGPINTVSQVFHDPHIQAENLCGSVNILPLETLSFRVPLYTFRIHQRGYIRHLHYLGKTIIKFRCLTSTTLISLQDTSNNEFVLQCLFSLINPVY